MLADTQLVKNLSNPEYMKEISFVELNNSNYYKNYHISCHKHHTKSYTKQFQSSDYN